MPDRRRLIEHCRWLSSRGAGLAVFGTNSEGNSLSLAEKADLLENLVEAGTDPARLMPGTGGCALTETVELTAHAVRLGCAGVLMLPPFYYKDVSDEGLFRAVSEVIERVGSDALRIYLYHIPPVARVGFSLPLVERLVRAWPRTVAGIKDSSGDWKNTAALLERGWPDFRVFSGSEACLLDNLRAGGAGCISAVANVNPGALVRLYREWRSDTAEDRQREIDAVRALFARYSPMIAALKAVIAHYRGDEAWENLRPPLVPLKDRERQFLLDGLERLGFSLSPEDGAPNA